MNNRLKNWVTIFKTVKNGKRGMINYLKYLNDNEHDNHIKDGHNVIDLGQDWEQVALNISSKIEERNTERLLKSTRGGSGIKKHAHSITLNIPYDIPNEKLKDIANKIINKFYVNINKNEKLFKSKEDYQNFKKDFIFFNAHKQTEGSKTQFNFVLPELIVDKKMDLSKKKYSYIFKQFSNEILKDFGYDFQQYDLKNYNQQYKNNNTYKTKKLNQDLKVVNELKEEYNHYIDLAKHKLTTLQDLDKTLSTYFNRLDKAVEAGDREKVEKLEKQIKQRVKKKDIDILDDMPTL